MSGLAAPAKIPTASIDIDPFSEEYLSDPYPHHEILRNAGPVVWLPNRVVWVTGRYAEVKAALTDWESFCSGGGVGLANHFKEPPWRTPSILLETDPPKHDQARAVMMRVLSPVALRDLRERMTQEAETLVDRLLERDEIEGMAELAEAFVLKVFPDAVGLPLVGRHSLVAYGDMVFNGMGPRNALFHAAMTRLQDVLPWITQCCDKAVLSRNGFGAQIYRAAESGGLTEDEAALLVRSLLSAGVDTTVYALGNALFCFATHPEQWDWLREDSSRIRGAFEEVMRYEPMFQTFFRTTTREVVLGGTAIFAGEKVMVSIGAANRDPRHWERPDVFDATRRASGHLGFGTGLHACVGQMVARLEIEIMLTALARRVHRIEVAAPPRRMMHNVLRGFASLPLRLRQ